MAEKIEWGEVDENGLLQLPQSFLQELGLKPGAKFRVHLNTNHLEISQSIYQLNKIYIEPTNHCNLNCTMCIRHAWDDQFGTMSEQTFTKILCSLDHFEPKPTVSFSGLGEPLMHPNILEWVEKTKQKGSKVELITNATLLDYELSQGLIKAGLDTLWVSIDSASPESFNDVRTGAQLSEVIKNVRQFKGLRHGGHHPRPQIGIAFVAMKDNIADLPKVMQLARSLGAKLFSASNVMPYTADMVPQMLYTNALKNITYLSSAWLPQASLPKIDLDLPEAQNSFLQALNSGWNIDFSGHPLSASNDICQFIAKGSTSIAWDGSLSPCWPLMHTHTSYLHNKLHTSYRHLIGNVNEKSLIDLWKEPDYVEYRRKVYDFSFAPCTFCGGCDLSVENMEDCLGNQFPACGTCLWSQGIIQCP